MHNLFLVLFLATWPAFQDQPATAEDHQARLLSRRDLPPDLNLPFEETGFAVLRITVRNRQEQELTIDPAQIRILDPKGKVVPQAEPTEVVPKLVKAGGFRPQVNAEVGGYRGPSFGRPYTGVGASTGGGVGVVDIAHVERIKSAVTTHQLKPTSLAPGEQMEGFLYLKTNKKPDELNGSRVLLTPQLTLTLE
jgi:hypothetical protein